MNRFSVLYAVVVGLLCFALPALGGDIHRAVEAGDVALVKQIIESDPGAVSQLGEGRFHDLPLHVAAAAGNIEIARLLLEAGADIDGGDSDNSTPLGVAAIRRQGEMVAFLIEQGANVNHRDQKADCPLSFAVYGQDEAIIQQILDAGADMYFCNPRGETLLHVAAGRGLSELVIQILDNNMYIDPQADGGGTPLGYAVMQGQAEVAQLLLDRGANPNPVPAGAASPLIFTSWRDQAECARILLENGANADHEGHDNNTALFWAADRCSTEIMTVFIKHGATVDHQNVHGETALVRAATGGYADRVEVLLAAKANPNVGTDRDGRSALQLAALGGYSDVALLLLAHNADVNAKTPSGATPLDLARYYGHAELATTLTGKGAKGSGSERVDRSLSAFDKVGKGEAVVWFLGHSGWAVKTQNHLLIFDYYLQGAEPAEPGLCNGRVDPAEIADQKVAVFASHIHGDHYDASIFEWQEQVTDITYFLGLEPQDTPPYEFMPERMEKTFGDLELTTIHSTDAGVGMVVEVDDVTIFHPGDHANGRIGLMDEFTDEIDFLADRGIRPDICFMGIRGCSLGRPDEVKEGIYYTLKKLEPKVFIPMHAAADGNAYREFVDECQPQFGSIQMVTPDNRGDHFLYKNGTIKDPKDSGTRQARVD